MDGLETRTLELAEDKAHGNQNLELAEDEVHANLMWDYIEGVQDLWNNVWAHQKLQTEACNLKNSNKLGCRCTNSIAVALELTGVAAGVGYHNPKLARCDPQSLHTEATSK
ncbi:hypothetical protein PGT21_008918 [Puccinia graminis f. sp. tritici]|uniref:Uncharacterized protein n=1 Tax=Puccinia graminis f. sp. tritici TaxID=56615 RepID=A0A5B0QXP4_PUCGR|nr:hypothetical protein PGT21_008918 [Puccinia graminis f. sp. tritici]